MLTKLLLKANNTFLNFFGGRTNRTDVRLIELPANETTKEIICPYGTWSFDIRVTADGVGEFYKVIHQGGVEQFFIANALVGGNPQELRPFFPGQPYIERQDSFQIKNDSNGTLLVYLTFHRVTKNDN